MLAQSRAARRAYIVSVMLAALLIRWAILGVAFAITSWLLSGMDVNGGFWAYVWVSAIFGLVNAFIGTIFRIFTFPLIILTFGLFSIFINACLLGITDWITDDLTIDEFWWTAIWASIILSLVSMVLDWIVSAVAGPKPAASY
jgi:putative membrane protein